MEEPVEQSTPQSAPKNDFWKSSAELVRTALIVGILAFAIRYFVLQPFIVEGSSMVPRFQTDDYLLVDKLSYRFKEPQRGDIVVFRYPFDITVNYVKRIIGLPGETIRIRSGQVFLINEAHPEGIKLAEPYINDGAQTMLPAGATEKDFVVPKDSYFVMGDNRPASSDSREWGMLPKDDLIGKVVIQAYPLDRIHLVPHAIYSETP
jgi:signal peptidase I